METMAAAQVAGVTSPADIFKATRCLVEEGDKYVVPEKRQEFEHRVALTQSDFIERLFKGIDKYVIPEKKLEFELQTAWEVANLIETLSKEAKIHSNGGWAKIEEEWLELRARAEILKRRLKLLNPSSQQDFEATLWWMVEQGVEEDLDLLQQVKKAPLHTSENIARLLELAVQWISERVHDSDYMEHIDRLTNAGPDVQFHAVSEESVAAVRRRGALRTRGTVRIPAPAAVPERLEAALDAMTQSADEDLRREAAYALGGLGGPASVPSLCNLGLQDPQPRVRAEAVSALGKIGGREAIEILLEAACDDSDETVRAGAVDALGNLLTTATSSGEARAIRQCLQRVAQTDLSSYVRKRAAKTGPASTT